MKKIVTILGARPQFIKAAAVSRAIASHREGIEEFIVHTGQHYDYKMSELFFEELSIRKPHINLAVGSGSHGEQTGRMLALIESELQRLEPDIVLVYGDTNSTLAGALAASKLHIPVAHVESGLRSFNKRMPEEINRIVTDHISDLLFAPTMTAISNLHSEGIRDERVYQTGDVMFDAIQFYRAKDDKVLPLLDELGINGKSFILVTIHRAENTDEPKRLKEIMSMLNEISKTRIVVFPIHPRTRKILPESFDKTSASNLKLIEPVGYLEMIGLQKYCGLVITDSGGIQKEAFLSNKYCLTLRNETEWTELVENGFNFLVNPISSLPNLVDRMWEKAFDDGGFRPYGDGDAALKIVTALKGYFF